jgi:hypothetical protein
MLALHIPGRGSREYPSSIEEAPYSDGETWLALATYRVLFPDNHQVEDVLRDYDGYLMRRYGVSRIEDFYSWGVAAASMRFAATQDPKFAEFIKAQTQYILAAPGAPSDLNDNSCGFVEGLAAAAKLLPVVGGGPDQQMAGLIARLDREMAKNRALQLRPGQTRVELADHAYLSSLRLSDYAGAFLAGVYSPRVQIDVTGHCLSALIELQELGGLR